MSLLTVLLILAVFGIVFVLVLVAVIRIETAREERARPDPVSDEASVD
jgi:heme/copper-type cytochrome/quinol oxidase subunit 2